MNAPKLGGWYAMRSQPGFIFWCLDSHPSPATAGLEVEWFLFRRYQLPVKDGDGFVFCGNALHPFINMVQVSP